MTFLIRKGTFTACFKNVNYVSIRKLFVLMKMYATDFEVLLRCDVEERFMGNE